LILWPALLLTAACGYHVGAQADLVPKNIHTVAIPPFANATVQYKLTDRLPEAIAREFINRTKYQVVSDVNQADAILKGTITNFVAYPTVFDQTTGRASGVQTNVTMQIQFVERATGKVIYTRPSFEAKQVYEVSTAGTSVVSARAYFDESETGLARLSKDVAREIVSAILENF
jgi:outer membrane lipopolysaccharide assembly protein LptE/RlpB